MKTYELKDGRKVKAVKDKTVSLSDCKNCILNISELRCSFYDHDDLPDCVENSIHFEKVEDEK